MAKNKIHYDREAKLIIDILDHDKLINEFIKRFSYALIGRAFRQSRSPIAVIARHFTFSARSAKTFPKLKASTLRRKKSNKMLVEEGNLKKKTRKKSTIRSKLMDGKLEITQDVPGYGEYIQEGTERMKARPFFSIRDGEDGEVFYNAVNDLMMEIVRKKGIKIKPV